MQTVQQWRRRESIIWPPRGYAVEGFAPTSRAARQLGDPAGTRVEWHAERIVLLPTGNKLCCIQTTMTRIWSPSTF